MSTAINLLLLFSTGNSLPPIGPQLIITEDNDEMITEDGDFIETE